MQQDVVKDILQKAFPEVCDAVGPANLAGIASGKAEFATPQTGQFFDILTFMQMLVAAAAFAKSCLDIREQLTKQARGRAPSKSEILRAAEKSATADGKLDDEEKRKILDSLP